MSKIAVIYHSTYGHTKLQAEAVHRGAQSVSADHYAGVNLAIHRAQVAIRHAHASHATTTCLVFDLKGNA